jgi:uncharacterized phage protein (TIGR02218 family)
MTAEVSMRSLSPALAAHLASGATTLARCWRITRRDGVVAGFTDHDRALVFDGVAHEPQAGFTASEAPAALGLAVPTREISGALVSPALTEADLAAGLYDGAEVSLTLVDWADPAERVLLDVAMIGEVTRQGAAFRAELRGLAHALDQERGRVIQGGCDAELGDARCGAPLSAPDRSAAVAVAAVIGSRSLRLTGADAIAAGRLTGGKLAWTTGANAGRVSEIRVDRADGSGRLLELWDAPAAPASPGDAANATVGCDKRFATCRDVFANALNFRGFPHVPGNDFALGYPRRGEGNDGGRLE